ncbi:MAG: pyruvate:ferredoxin (flavodoxin) oxidoreductase [Muribaculaceae bacterium]|nr:pyruvate:ferredoxin (flavodoxin) oxidoreductase [Muribaculaceae bacterium]
MKKSILDGCTAAAHVAYALSDVATIYPITPIASMGQTAQKWGLQGRLNLMGQAMEVREMESELGAAGAVHGAAAAGALATTFTASQGLMLMIPNMYKIAGEQLPVVFHVGCRSLATHALSIFGDHQDVMACRATGFTMLVSASVQETMDLALVAHLAAIDGSLPVLHFFDGWRTSSEMDSIDVIDYGEMKPLVDWDKVNTIRRRGMNPEHPRLRGSAQNGDVYFQNSEAVNPLYDAFPAIVQKAMDKVATVTGRQYHTVDYFGAPDADRVIVIMASGADVASETALYLNSLNKGYKTGVIKVRLYRPFPVDDFVRAIPETVKSIAVLDRTKEPGAQHEPLCLDVISALQSRRPDIHVVGGRYGLSSKEFNPSMAKAVFDYLASGDAASTFTVGINDDVTHLSLSVTDEVNTASHSGVKQAVFYGIGNDGTVGATRQVATVLDSTASLYAQAYFSYSAKKSGGYTISQLRVSPRPITSAYSISRADYIGCHKAGYVRRFAMLNSIREEGTFVINCPWQDEDLARNIPLEMRRRISAMKLKLYVIDADAIAASVGLAPRINMPMETVFLYLSGIIPFKQGYDALAEQIRLTYAHEGNEVVERNLKAISMAVPALRQVDYASIEGWETEPEVKRTYLNLYRTPEQKRFIETIHTPCIKGEGDSVPVSAFAPDGTMPMGTTAFEHRCIATRIPVWDAEKCVECTECSLVCPHAVIRPYLLDSEEAAKAPEGFVSKPVDGDQALKGLRFRIQVSPTDCMGCSSCSLICPGHALTMTPADEVMEMEQPLYEWALQNVKPKETLVSASTVRGSQLQTPLFEFSGACAGCGETPYIKLLTQLMGRHLVMANATGCSSVYGADYPSNPYCTDADGRGPAWGNSLFEDNAEYGFGILTAITHLREGMVSSVKELVEAPDTVPYLKTFMEAWLAAKDLPEQSRQTAMQLKGALEPVKDASPQYKHLYDNIDLLPYKSVWAVGGDGWAYDIGFAGLDHVLASGENIKLLVLDTECYSNTGGQTSKATPRSCVAKYSPDGKSTPKKDLGRMMMTYGNVYVASIALGANYQQAITALIEAERYDGPAIVIAYCPCINHGIRPGLGHSAIEERRAVESGYWPLYRFNPEAYARGEKALTVDGPVAGPDNSGSNGSTPEVTTPRYKQAEPLTDVAEFTMDDDRYADLRMVSPVRAAILGPQLQQDCDRTNNILNQSE